MSMIRTRWAAIGAAVAVTLGGGGLFVANAADSTSDSLFHPVTPVRVMDTRVGGTAVVNTTVKLDLEGTIATYNADGSTTNTEVVPDSATSVAINLTVTGGLKNGDYGFVTAFPCTAVTDTPPTASSLNFENRVDIANALNVTTSSSGEVCFNVYGTAHLIVDVAGYYDDSRIDAIETDISANESRIDAIEADYLDNDASITMSYMGNMLLPTALSGTDCSSGTCADIPGIVTFGAESALVQDAAGIFIMPLQAPYQISTLALGGRYRLSTFSVCLPIGAFTNGGYISSTIIYDEDGQLYTSGALTTASWTAGQCKSFTLSGTALPIYGSQHYQLALTVVDSDSGNNGDVRIGSVSATYSPCACSLALFPIPIFPLFP